jgi:hypothetical protein
MQNHGSDACQISRWKKPEAGMKFQYRGFAINATPDEEADTYVAHARISARKTNASSESSVLIDVGDLGRFPREALAVEHAVDWAIAWITENSATLT